MSYLSKKKKKFVGFSDTWGWGSIPYLMLAHRHFLPAKEENNLVAVKPAATSSACQAIWLLNLDGNLLGSSL